MIVFLNGPFGVGKSTTARILATLLPQAVHYNPEHIGAGLRMAFGPLYRVTDYQDVAAWRRLVPVGARLCRLRYRTVVMPMTVWRRDYLDELVERLQCVDDDLVDAVAPDAGNQLLGPEEQNPEQRKRCKDDREQHPTGALEHPNRPIPVAARHDQRLCHLERLRTSLGSPRKRPLLPRRGR